VDAVGLEEFAEWLHSNEKSPGAKQPRLQKLFEVFRTCRDFSRDRPSCLAGYFAWPQVALTHHVCHRCLYARGTPPVKHPSDQMPT
jgi:hypothetical protein